MDRILALGTMLAVIDAADVPERGELIAETADAPRWQGGMPVEQVSTKFDANLAAVCRPHKTLPTTGVSHAQGGRCLPC
jgi:hypothetical protein